MTPFLVTGRILSVAENNWLERIIETKKELNELLINFKNEFDSRYHSIKEWNKMDFLSILYLRLLYTVGDCLHSTLAFFIKNKTYFSYEEQVDQVLDRTSSFLKIKYKGYSESELVTLINNLDSIAHGFDGKAFGNWSVRDILGSIRGKEYPNYDQEILSHVKNDQSIQAI